MESIFKRKQDVVRPLNRPLHGTGHLVILHGNLALTALQPRWQGLKTDAHHRSGAASSTAKRRVLRPSKSARSKPETWW